MTEKVTKQEFYAAMGPRDVHPTPTGRWDDVRRDYRTEWKTRDGRVVGISFGDEYSLTEEAARNG